MVASTDESLGGGVVSSSACQDEYIQQLYNAMAERWPLRTKPEKKAKTSGDGQEENVADENEGQEPDTEVPEAESTDDSQDSQDASGETTPNRERRLAEAEYLAWTLGGELREVYPSPSPCPAAEVPTPGAEIDVGDCDEQLARLEQLVHRVF